METSVIAPHHGFQATCLVVHTSRARQFLDITDDVREHVEQSGIQQGIVVVASRHTTASIVVNEHEPELLKDLDRLLSELAPEDQAYAHNAVPCGPGEQPNGHSHCQALLLSSSASIPVAGGRLTLGRYQRIFLIELDCPREREVTIALLGI
jgi:secondary thiamine-phosphate synthase enzyme